MFQPVLYYAINPLHSQANSCIDWSPVNYICTIQQPPILMTEEAQIPLHSHGVLSWLVIGLRTALCLREAELWNSHSCSFECSVRYALFFRAYKRSGLKAYVNWPTVSMGFPYSSVHGYHGIEADVGSCFELGLYADVAGSMSIIAEARGSLTET